MIIIIGLIVLVAALVVGVTGVLGNGGPAHAVTHFSVLGYHLTGSAGTLFLYGIVVGAAGLLGLSILLVGARRTSRRGSAARRRLRESRRETAAASSERDALIDQRDTALAETSGKLDTGTGPRIPQPRPADDRWTRLRAFGHRLAPAQATAPPSDLSAGEPEAGPVVTSPAPEVPAGVSAPAE